MQNRPYRLHNPHDDRDLDTERRRIDLWYTLDDLRVENIMLPYPLDNHAKIQITCDCIMQLALNG
jgi:hypothetical protein